MTRRSGRGERSRMLFTIGFAITTQHVGDFQRGTSIGRPQKYSGVTGLGSMGTACGSRSSGLVVDHTLVVAMRR